MLLQPSSGVRVLLAHSQDPSQEFWAAIAAHLRRLGPEVEIETCLLDAAEDRARQQPSELYLVNADPELTQCAPLLAQCRRADLPWVALTPTAQPGVAVECFRRGAADCLEVRPEMGDALVMVVMEQIRRRQEQRERELLRQRAAYAARWASIGRLAGGLAHEINNPTGFVDANLMQMAQYAEGLNRLWGASRELQKQVQAGEPAGAERAAHALEQLAKELDPEYLLSDLANAVRESREGTQRIRHLLRDLRDLVREDSDEPAWVDINQSLDSTANVVWGMIPGGVRLQKDYQDLPRVLCFEAGLRRVFLDLLVNAHQAIQALPTNPSDGTIQVATGTRDGGVVISIRDDGVGIPVEHRPHLFEPFFTTKAVGEGTGLGLATAFSVVQRHGGEIQVESQLGRGACFEIWLPKAPPDHPAQQVAS